jgi:predicted nucleic acid-binding protein
VITAIDSSVIVDILDEDAGFKERSIAALTAARLAGDVIASTVVWAETASRYPTASAALRVFVRLGIEYGPITAVSAHAAGRACLAYRARGGTRDQLIPDFLIGAHALHQADRLLTRDSAFQRRNFPGLEVIDPTKG